MTNINVYDVDAETINKVAKKSDMSVADVISILVEYIDVEVEQGYLKNGE